ncbi:MAG: hypothetical protein ACKO37_03200 [Vampirovibrionales bacterium]
MPNTTSHITLQNFLGGMLQRPETLQGLESTFVGPTGQSLSAQMVFAHDIENFMPVAETGAQTKVYGYTLWNQLPDTLNPVQALYRFQPNDGKAQWLMVQNGTWYSWYDTEATPRVLRTDLPKDSTFHFETAYQGCVLCDSVNAPWYYAGDGTTPQPLEGHPPVGAVASLFYKERLFVFSRTQEPSLLYHSDVGNIASGYDTSFIPCDLQTGDSITSVYRFFHPAQGQPLVFVGKQQSMGILDGQGTESDPFVFLPVSQHQGVVGPHAFVGFGQDVTYITPTGIDSWRSDVTTGNLFQAQLSSGIQSVWQTLNPQGFSRAMSWLDTQGKRLCYALPEAGGFQPSVILCLDLQQGTPTGWYKVRPSHPVVSVGVDKRTGTVLFGSSMGKVYQWNPESTHFAGEAIRAYYKTPFMTFGKPIQFKRILNAWLQAKGSADAVCRIDTLLDYGNRMGGTSQLSFNDPSYRPFTWLGGQWSDTMAGYQWQGDTPQIRQWIPAGQFTSLQLSVQETTLHSVFTFYGIDLSLEYLSL